MAKPVGAVRLTVQPISVTRANDYVDLVHRHHGPILPASAYFAICVVDPDNLIRGVATAAIPNAANRITDGFRIMEVTRVATDGTPNACSALYAACARAARELGFSRIITYVLEEETGASIKGAGWKQDEGVFGSISGIGWANRPGRSNTNSGPKGRWSLELAGTDRPLPEFPVEVDELRPEKLQLSIL